MPNIVSNLGSQTGPNAPQGQQIVDQSAANNAHAVVRVPFGKSAKRIIAQGGVVSQNPWSTLAPAQQPISLPVIGWLSEVKLTVTESGGTGVAATPGNDSPWNVAQNIQLLDPTGAPIVNLPGYSLYIARLFGGYRPYRPDASTFGYSAIANGGTGAFKIIFDIFQEFSLHMGLGCLDDRDGASPWSLQVTWNALTAGTGPNNVYGVVPSGGTPVLTILPEVFGRAVVQSVADKNGNPQEQTPPAQGTIKYLTNSVIPVTSGLNTIQLKRVGNFIRAHHLIFRDASGIRSNADSTGVTPTTITFQWDNQNRFVVNTQTLRQWAYEMFGFDVPAGVVPLPYTADPDGIPLAEGGFEYMPTIASTLINLVFTSSAAGTLEVITEDIVPGPNVQL
jgi:hypothetical protein